MYPDQIKNYTTEKQFKDHEKMLFDLEAYYGGDNVQHKITLMRIDDERKLLDRSYRKWKKKQEYFEKLG